MILHNAAGREVDQAQRRAAIQSGAFIEMAIDIDQALGEGLGVMRIGVNDLIGIRAGWWGRCPSGDGTGRAEK